MIKRFLKIFLVFTLFFGLMAIDNSSKILANTAKELNDVVLSELNIVNSDNSEITAPIFSSHEIKVLAKFDASSYTNTLKEGDFFTIQFNDSFSFKGYDASQLNIPLRDENNLVLANLAIVPNANGGGVATIIIAKGAENRYDVKGKFTLVSKMNEAKFNKIPDTYPFVVEGNTTRFEKGIAIKFHGVTDISNLLVDKMASGDPDNGRVRWRLYINPKKETPLTNVVITDTISETDQDNGNAPLNRVRHIQDSFELLQYEMDGQGNPINDQFVRIPLNGMLTFSNDGRTFTLRMPDASGKQYRLQYYTTYYPGFTTGNRVDLSADGGITAQVRNKGYRKNISSGDAQS